MCYSFLVSDATKYGADNAIILNLLRIFERELSISEIYNLFPFYGKVKIKRILEELEKHELIVGTHEIGLSRYEIMRETIPTIGGIGELAAKKSTSAQEIDEFFDYIWKLYPQERRCGKGKVSLTQKKKLMKIGKEEIERCIDRYKEDKICTDMQYLYMASTFFNSGYVDYLDENYNSIEEQAISHVIDSSSNRIIQD